MHGRPVVVWNVTPKCNLACVHCYAAERKGADAVLGTDEAKRVIDDLAAWKVPVLLFSGGEPFCREDIRELAEYAAIDGAALKRNLHEFLNEITPTLDETGIDMAIHPDDPPFPIFGIPRVVSCAADIREMVRACPSKHVGLALCTGSLGGNPANDAVAIFREFHDRIHFGHFRNLVHSSSGVFRESDSHLVGNTDMPALMLELLKEESRRGREIVVRPDHGRKLDIDRDRTCYSGYDYGGRLIGISELRGLEAGIKFMVRMSGQCPSHVSRFSPHSPMESR